MTYLPNDPNRLQLGIMDIIMDEHFLSIQQI